MRRVPLRAMTAFLGIALATGLVAAATASVVSRPGTTAAPAADCCWVAITDQGAKEITVLDPTQTDWNPSGSAAVKWRWSPNARNGFSATTPGWGTRATPTPRSSTGGATKSIGNHPTTGQVLRTRPKSGCTNTWCTDTVEFFGPDTTRTRTGAEIYKARWWYQEYQ